MSNSRISNLYFLCVCITIRQIALYLPALTEFIAWARIICLYNMFFPFHLQYILCESGYVYIVSVNFLCRVSRTIGLFVLFDFLVGGYLPKYLYKNNNNTNTKENTQYNWGKSGFSGPLRSETSHTSVLRSGCHLWFTIHTKYGNRDHLMIIIWIIHNRILC